MASAIPTNQSSSEGFKGPNSGVMGKMEYTGPLLNYLHPLTNTEINVRVPTVAELT